MAISVADRVFSLIEDTVAQQGVKLWDVRFVKEGANWYLRVIIDSENGISIDNCTDVHHAIDPLLDEADPIDKSYYLEVCSPGLERELTRDFHFEWALGKKVKVRLYKAVDSVKEFSGTLIEYDAQKLTIEDILTHHEFAHVQISSCKLDDIDF